MVAQDHGVGGAFEKRAEYRATGVTIGGGESRAGRMCRMIRHA
ncbi:hypothetical protein ASZ90_000811 [hydrocarbon metagenome]|uniref:Uncharacterized protein n=1 Tax=hydrocarbon metagenome TaxID=938273 RepID=A0A0W8G8G5_9ZZZZ